MIQLSVASGLEEEPGKGTLSYAWDRRPQPKN
jgi:hypothetical protein